MAPILSLQDITKTFATTSGIKLDILKGVNFELQKNEVVALTGASGTGKTTLLQIMGLIDAPTHGKVDIMGTYFEYIGVSDVQRQNSCRLTQRLCRFISRTSNSSVSKDNVRREHIGFVYQYHHLLPELTAMENVMLPLLISHKPGAAERAEMLLDEMKLGDRLNHFPSQLSGGEQQRVAVARALANSPEIILADEPTGNLDDITAHSVFDLLLELAQNNQLSAVVATHNVELAKKTTRWVELHLGQIGPAHC
ncbi:MAG: ABC transporter ATP-binding protein [Holosporales bacterium]|nr:ABC transporter ATP-binding protein [Holosporales bacterium]